MLRTPSTNIDFLLVVNQCVEDGSVSRTKPCALFAPLAKHSKFVINSPYKTVHRPPLRPINKQVPTSFRWTLPNKNWVCHPTATRLSNFRRSLFRNNRHTHRTRGKEWGSHGKSNFSRSEWAFQGEINISSSSLSSHWWSKQARLRLSIAARHTCWVKRHWNIRCNSCRNNCNTCSTNQN